MSDPYKLSKAEADEVYLVTKQQATKELRAEAAKHAKDLLEMVERLDKLREYARTTDLHLMYRQALEFPGNESLQNIDRARRDFREETFKFLVEVCDELPRDKLSELAARLAGFSATGKVKP